MPALEIMPQCATMEEAQRRANTCIQRGSGLPHSQVPSSSTRPKELLGADDHHEHDHNTTTKSPKPSTGRFGRFVKRNLRGLRRRSFPPYHGSGDAYCKEEMTEQPDTPAASGGSRTTTSSTATVGAKTNGDVTTREFAQRGTASADAGFSPIGVRYWPKIMEDEEEEPPEALQFDSWFLSSNKKDEAKKY